MLLTRSCSDDDLLTAGGPDGFALFYRRHVESILRYYVRSTRNPEVAADLAAETFAAALDAKRRFEPGGAPARRVAVRHRFEEARRLPAARVYGKASDSNAKRKLQAERVAKIVRRLRNQGEKHIVVLDDLNDTPDSAPLAPLFSGTVCGDISTHPNFASDGRPGTFANGTTGNKIDYVLLSPALYSRVTGGAVFRKGVWGGKHGTLFPHYETMTRPNHAASDHAAIFADIDI